MQGQICDILRPKLAMNRIPALLATQIPTLCIHTSGGRGRGGALILDRCRALDLFASVDALSQLPPLPSLFPILSFFEFGCSIFE